MYRETRLKHCALIRYYFHIEDSQLEYNINRWPDEKLGELVQQIYWVRTELKKAQDDAD